MLDTKLPLHLLFVAFLAAPLGLAGCSDDGSGGGSAADAGSNNGADSAGGEEACSQDIPASLQANEPVSYDNQWSLASESPGDIGAFDNAPLLAAAQDGTLFAAGEDASGGSRSVRVLRFDGSAWTAVGTPFSGATDKNLLDLVAGADGSPLVLVGDAQGLNTSGATLYGLEGGAWTALREIAGEVFDARAALHADGGEVLAYLLDQGSDATLMIDRRASDGTWQNYEYGEVSRTFSTVAHVAGLPRLIAMATRPGADVWVLATDRADEVFVRVSADGVEPLQQAPPEALSGSRADWNGLIGLSPADELYYGVQKVTDPGESGTTGDEVRAGYLYKWDGSAWSKVNEDDCLAEAADPSLGTPSFSGGTPGVSIAVDLLFDSTGAPVIASGGQTSTVTRLAANGRFYRLISFNRVAGQFAQPQELVTPDGSIFYGAADFDEGYTTVELEL